MYTTSRSARLRISLAVWAASAALTACRPDASPALMSAPASVPAVKPVGASSTSVVVPRSPNASNAKPVPGTHTGFGCAAQRTHVFARTRLVGDLRIVAGTFDHYIYEPWQAGAFNQPNPRRTMAIRKAAGAAAFDVEVLAIATRNIKEDPSLCQLLLQPIRQLGEELVRFGGQPRTGQSFPLADAERALITIEVRARSAGLRVMETTR